MKTLDLHITVSMATTEESLPTKEKRSAKGGNPAQKVTARQLPLPFKKTVGYGQQLKPLSAKAARTG